MHCASTTPGKEERDIPPTLSQVEKGALRESLGEFDMCPLEIEEDKSWCLTLI